MTITRRSRNSQNKNKQWEEHQLRFFKMLLDDYGVKIHNCD